MIRVLWLFVIVLSPWPTRFKRRSVWFYLSFYRCRVDFALCFLLHSLCQRTFWNWLIAKPKQIKQLESNPLGELYLKTLHTTFCNLQWKGFRIYVWLTCRRSTVAFEAVSQIRRFLEVDSINSSRKQGTSLFLNSSLVLTLTLWVQNPSSAFAWELHSRLPTYVEIKCFCASREPVAQMEHAT